MHKRKNLSIVRNGAVGLLCAGALTVGLSGAAPAEEPVAVIDSGGWDRDITAAEDRLPLTPEVAAKSERALRTLLVTPGVTEAVRRSAENDLRSVAAVAARDAQVSAASSTVAAAAPASRTLSITHTAQSKSYFCGPATAMMILREEGLTTSRDGKGRSLTQANLALTDYLSTEANGATNWVGLHMPNGLNKWSGNNWYLAQQSPTGGQFQGALLNTLGVNGKGVAVDTVERAGGAHYNGHPADRLIGHWMMAYGYSSSGAKVNFADPSTSFYPNATKTFSVSTNSFTTTYLQDNGIVY